MKQKITGTPPPNISRIVLQGYKSIKGCDLTLSNLNVLIGPNGAGKSNFISFFSLLIAMVERKLQVFTAKNGGPDELLYFGRDKTRRIFVDITTADGGYAFMLEPTKDNKLLVTQESVTFYANSRKRVDFPSGLHEPAIGLNIDGTVEYHHVSLTLESWRAYHFNDTGDDSNIKRLQPINDNAFLRPDAGNLAAFLFRLQKNFPQNFQMIEKTVALAAPFFAGFHLRPDPDNKDIIQLEWREHGSERPFKAHHLSDGTLRLICLATVLLQPDGFLPATVIIDEPELGLHPYAIGVTAGMLKSASTRTQIIASTQSVELLNHFSLEDIIVADRTDNGTHLHRVDGSQLTDWLDEYGLGELWEKNLIGGRPSR